MGSTLHPPTWIELSESALRGNLRFLRRRIGKETRLVSVVKSNAYGHGLEHYIPLAEKCGVSHFAVFNAMEAERVLASRTRGSSILIMGHVDDQDLRWAVENDIAFYVFDLGRLDAAIRAARKVGRPARVHLEVETGLQRVGLSNRSMLLAVDRFRKYPDQIQAEGICTHFAGAESFSNDYRIRQQIQAFEESSRLLQQRHFRPKLKHAACSAVIFNYPDCIHDMVRPGISQYGYWPSQETQMAYQGGGSKLKRRKGDPLRRIMSWKSRVMNLKTVPAGTYVGYGNSYLSSRKMRLAAVPTGYYHGFARAQSNLGRVLIRGIRCSVVGVVNMSMFTVDVTEVPGVENGDEVVIIGRQGDGEVSVGSFGERIHELNYEVLVRLPNEIPRVVVD